MKTIGLLGGMSWESTTGYYRAINEGIRARLGGLHSAKIVMHSVDFSPIEKLQRAGDWNGAATILCEAALGVQQGGADCLLICTNTMHKVAAQIESAIVIPLLHIADATAQELVKFGVKKVGLLGTGFTMEEDFYKGRIREKYGIEVLVPDKQDRNLVHQVIYDELCIGKVECASRTQFLRIISELSAQGAEAVILGCTELGMLVNQSDTPTPLFDTTAIHSAKAVAWALSD